MSPLHKFIDSLHIRFHHAGFREVVEPLELFDVREKCNYIVLLDRGDFIAGKEQHRVHPNSFYFFPGGQAIYARHGKNPSKKIPPQDFLDLEARARHFIPISGLDIPNDKKDVFVAVAFEVLLYETIPFFEVLGLPPFPLVSDTEFGHLIRYIALESEQQKLGRDKIIRNYMEEIIIHLCRYMDNQSAFKPYLDKLEFLTDRRLVDIVTFIKERLSGDLSNKVLANVAYVSEDYVGQFFKSLTGKNLQEYIEEQRLQRAHFLIRNSPDSIQEIAHQVGFKDPAYFSRRFKLRFGQNATALRD
ncbi:MAG: hypothetical protein RIQ47_876, partial [Bacteroidota bacterium]